MVQAGQTQRPAADSQEILEPEEPPLLEDPPKGRGRGGRHPMPVHLEVQTTVLVPAQPKVWPSTLLTGFGQHYVHQASRGGNCVFGRPKLQQEFIACEVHVLQLMKPFP